MQRTTRSQSKLAFAEKHSNVINRASSALTYSDVPAQNGTEMSNLPKLHKRKQCDISDAVPGLDSAPSSKKLKTEIQSNEPQFKPAIDKENPSTTPTAGKPIGVGQIMRSHDLENLRLFFQSDQCTPDRLVQLLHATVDCGWLEGFDALIQNGAMNESRKADLLLSENGKFTLFQKAVLSQNSIVLDRLSTLDCPMYRRSRAELKGAISLAAHTGNPDILSRLCGAADVERVRWSPLEMSYFFKAAVIGTRTRSSSFVPGEAAIDYLRGRYPDSVVRSTYDEAVLAAVKLDNWNAAASLLGVYGANPEARDSDEQTALMHAAKNGRLDVYELLRFHEASPYALDSNGKSVLHHAVEGGNESIVSDLVGKCKVNTKVIDASRQTASGLARILGSDAIQDLITWGVHRPFDSTDY